MGLPDQCACPCAYAWYKSTVQNPDVDVHKEGFCVSNINCGYPRKFRGYGEQGSPTDGVCGCYDAVLYDLNFRLAKCKGSFVPVGSADPDVQEVGLPLDTDCTITLDVQSTQGDTIQITGIPLSQLHKEKPKKLNYDYFSVSLVPSIRSKLHSTIDNRLESMIDEGLIDEVKALLDSDKLDSKTNSMKSVGYKQICEYLETKCSLVEAKDNAKTSTRRLAKRQLTWLRSESSDIEFDIYNDNIIDKAKLALDSFINDKQS